MVPRILIALILGGAIAMSSILAATVSAADCGDNVPCACGNNLVSSRKLVAGKSRDPVLNLVCNGNGLVVNTSGVILDLNAGKLRGSGKGVGVLIVADGVTIMNGRIDKFGTGIGTESTGSQN